MRWRKNTPPPAGRDADPGEAVRTWEELTRAARDMAGVDDAVLAADPASNPRLLDERVATADAVSHAVLAEERERAEAALAKARRARRAADERGERAQRSAEARADTAEATLAAIDAYEQADNPAASALSLHMLGPRIRRALTGIAMAGAAASAVGVAAWAAGSWPLAAAVGVGALAEVLLTTPVIMLTAFQGAIRTHHKGAALAEDGDARRVLGAMRTAVLALLAASVAINLTGILVGGTGLLGAVGITGAVIAFGASIASWGVATVIREVIASNVAVWRTSEWAAERARLEALAAGEHIPAPAAPTADPAPSEQERPGACWAVYPAPGARVLPIVPDAPAPVEGEEERLERVVARVLEQASEARVRAEADRGTQALQSWLDGRGPGGGGPVTSARPGADPTPPWAGHADPAEAREPGAGAAGGHIDSDQPSGPAAADDGGEASERVVSAAEARRAAGEATARRVADYEATNPGATVGQIAEALGISQSTVKRARRRLNPEGSR